jgi:hypothetical protein
MKPTFKLDDTILLTLLLKQNKMTKRDLIKRVKQQYRLDDARLLDTARVEQKIKLPGTDVPVFTDYDIYDTGRHLVKATKYGKIKDIEQKAQSVLQPKVIVKKRRTITRQ